MPDIIDIILDKLSPSSLDLLDEIDLNANRQSRHYSEEIQKSLDTVEEIYLKRCSFEVDNKTELLASKTRELEFLLDKYTNQFTNLQIIQTNNDSAEKIRAYDRQVENLQKQLGVLTNKSVDGLEPDEVFIRIHDMHKKIEELDVKCNEIKERLKHYENFPASITKAQTCIADLKERIKEKEAIVESSLCGKNLS